MSSPPSGPLPSRFKTLGDLLTTTSVDCIPGTMLYTIGFRLTDKSDDPWSDKFNRFKSGDKVAVAAGARTIVAALQSIAYKPMRRIVLGAISSKDTQLATGSPVHVLCESIANSMGWEHHQGLLNKKTHKSLHSIKTGGLDRDNEVSNVYKCAVLGGKPGRVFIVDDFTTRGATAGDIMRAFIQANPGWDFRCVSLAKTERVAYWEDKGGISNSHIPKSLENIWANK